MAKNNPSKNIPHTKPLQNTVRSSSNTKTKQSSSKSLFSLPASQNTSLLFDKTNYIIMVIGVLLIIIGFFMMSGGNTDPKVFNEAEIYSFRRITLAPITVVSGFIVIIVAILKKPASTIEV